MKDTKKNLKVVKKKEEDYPKTKDGQVDFMKMIDTMFDGQVGVVQYVQQMCKGYALDQSLKTASNLMKKLDAGITDIKMQDIIPTEIIPNKDI
tara:strand:- start:1301 stop:1579 length:279 start_codon:yes stop_codon:yes gene_type:complete